MADWHVGLKEKLRASIPYAFSCDGSSAPVLSEEEFESAFEFLAVEVEELLRKSFQLGHLIAGSDIVDSLRNDGIVIDDFNEELDKHYSEKKWQEVKKSI